MVANLVTRGMGTSSRMVTQGYGGTFVAAVAAVAEIVKKAVIRSRDATKHIPEILYIVKATLIDVNSKELDNPIAGTKRKIVDPSEKEVTISAELKTEDVKRALREILIKAVPSVRARFIDGKKRE